MRPNSRDTPPHVFPKLCLYGEIAVLALFVARSDGVVGAFGVRGVRAFESDLDRDLERDFRRRRRAQVRFGASFLPLGSPSKRAAGYAASS